MNFELEGEIAGFVRDHKGRRRMLVRSGEDEFLLKVNRELRRGLKPGDRVSISGQQKGGSGAETVQRKALEIKWLSGMSGKTAPKVPVKIRVCDKKNCWEAGGRELWEQLERRARESGVTVELKAVHCLGNCKRAPNLKCRGCLFERCRPADVDALIARLQRGQDPSP